MPQVTPPETMRFPPRRDKWDALEYYLLVLAGGGLLVGSMFVVQGIAQVAADKTSPRGWFALVFGATQFTFGAAAGVLRTWQRYAEVYELSGAAFLHDGGYFRVYVPLAAISEVHPIKICRTTTTLKEAIRIKVAAPKGSACVGGRLKEVRGYIEYALPGFRWRVPHGKWHAIDISPENRDGFLDELAARLPHLVRDGLRLTLPDAAPASSTPTSEAPAGHSSGEGASAG